jgi:hypothetical protein
MSERKPLVSLHVTYKQAKMIRNLIDAASSNHAFEQGDLASLYLNVDSDIEVYEDQNDLNQGE